MPVNLIARCCRAGVLSLIALFLLAGCATTRYEYVGPKTDAGRYCANQCAGVREQCLAYEMQHSQYELSRCERRNQAKYHDCMEDADNRKEAQKCGRYLNSCWAGDGSGRCDSEYRQCFNRCGGKVIRIDD